MNALQRLIQNAHPALNKDPVPQPSLHITSTSDAVIFIRDGTMQLTGQSPIQLSSYTISSLASYLSSLNGYTATAVVNGTLSALSMIDDTYRITATQAITIPIFTSILWQIFATLALRLEQLRKDDVQADFQITPQTASTYWLDSLGELYGVTRQQGEPDTLYAIRLFDFSLATRVNNVAIEKILNDLGYQSSVVDVTPSPALDVNVSLPTSPPQGFVYTTGSLGALVDRLKASGVTSTINLEGQLSDTIHVSDSVSSVTNPKSWTWGNFVWGQFTWNDNSNHSTTLTMASPTRR